MHVALTVVFSNWCRLSYHWSSVWYLEIDSLTGVALRQIVDGFRNDLGFPQCAGAVDGSHIPIISLQECPANYYNREG